MLSLYTDRCTCHFLVYFILGCVLALSFYTPSLHCFGVWPATHHVNVVALRLFAYIPSSLPYLVVCE